MGWRRCDTRAQIDDDDIGIHLPHRSIAELLLAILQLGNCPPLPDSHDIW
jgi:hypothetical protein